MPQENSKKHQLPQRSLAYLFYLSFGIFGTQMAFGLESSQLGRLFQTIGASPELLGIIFIIPPLTGLFVQPIIGKYSDQTWLPKLGGRRVPYLIIGSILTALTLILLPNSGSFGWPTTIAVWVATAILGIFMIASNIAVQPYKMMVGDLVNQEQRGQAYSIQSQLLNAGATIASITPFVMTTFGMANTAEAGVVPATVKYAFYLAAFALLVSATITVVKIKENNPIEFAAVHGGDVDQPRKSMWQLTKEAPRIFWLVGLVQFFGFFAVSYLWFTVQDFWRITSTTPLIPTALGTKWVVI
ncbi:MFS transporter [Eupransor demetentiae]|uniref:Na+/melibiose symporter or related transporter (MelB) n=1 Tax=Eupransor demetentiae TaxID=3109584 RepID=A0ABP0ERN5_9LACO|nr:Na+/melibiose symporter or related transporter (MelB) [Lactobacillaceae bacterium LMG 33000]